MPSPTATLERDRPARADSFPDSAFPIRIPLRAVRLLTIAALLTGLAWPMLAGRVYLADDLGDFHLPLRAFYANQLAHGQAFDWCPDLYCGFYLTGEGQIGSYHPLHYLLYRWLPLPLAFDLECWLTYPFMLAGMYLFLRRWSLPEAAAVFGAMAFAFGSFSLLHFVHPNAVAIIAHLPWLLWAIDVLLRADDSRSRRLAFSVLSLLTASQLLLGYPQYVLFSLLVEFSYVLWRASIAPRNRSILSALAIWIASVSLGFVIGAVQLLPTLDALQHSVRQTIDAHFAAQGSLHPLNVIQLVAPYLFATRVVGQNTHELGLYFGAVPLVAAAYAVFRTATRAHRRLALAALLLAGLGLLWSFGQFGPFAWLQANLPLVRSFRFPCRAIVIFQFAIAVLAAIGFAAIERESSQADRTRARPLWVFPLASIALAAYSAFAWSEFLASWPLVIAGPLLVCAATALTWLATRGARWAIPAMVVLAAADIGIYGLSHSIASRTQTLSDFVQNVSTPPGQPGARVALDLIAGTEAAPMPTGLRVGDQILLAGWRRVDGYAGLEPARQLDYRQPAALRAAGAGWISQRAIPQLQDASIATDGAWTPISDPRPRTWLVTQAVPSTNPATDITRIDLADAALVDRPVELPSAVAGKATVLEDVPGYMSVATDAPTPQLLVVNECHHSGWRSSIDGQQADVLRANGDFLGVVVPAGPHDVRFEFQPASLRLGRLFTWFGLGLIGALLVWPARSNHS